jgi:hypothetical protein
LQPSELTKVIVTGSSSGRHMGRVEALPDGAGTAFLPYQPFTSGEQVQVTATLSSPAAGTASGDPGATTLSFFYVVAVSPASVAGDVVGARAPSQAAGPVQSFHSAPTLHPPDVGMSSDPDTVSGDIFLTPDPAPQPGAMILDGQGRLVWFHPSNGSVANLEVQRYRRQPVLTWFQQVFSDGASINSDVIMNQHYQPVRALHAAEGYTADSHEFKLTPRGTALIDADILVRADLSSVGGSSNGFVSDCVVQELDIRTGQLLWEWHMLGHVPLNASLAGTPGTLPDDYCHLNSIQELSDGNLLISARNTWAVYEIDKQTGGVIWTLGGRYSSFHIGPGANFEWQHDAELTGDTLSLFDDGDYPQEEGQSSAKILRLNTTTMTVSLLHRYTHGPPVLAPYEGNVQVLPDHDVFVGWGEQPEFSEYTPGGKQILTGALPLGISSYRTYRFPWHGFPVTRPSLAITPRANGTVLVSASWNGATEVAAWRVLGGSRLRLLHRVDTVTRTGFETRIALASEPRYLAVEALGAHGKVLGTSRVLAP